MPQSLSTVHDILGPLFTKTFDVVQREKIRTISSQLPPVAFGGFEFSLIEDASQHVDVLQYFDKREGGAKRLESFIRRRESAQTSLWGWLADLCGVWKDNTADWSNGLAGIWLEIDSLTFSESKWTPSIFFEFEQKRPPSAKQLNTLLELTPAPQSAIKQDILELIYNTLPDGAFISHLGMMLSRPDAPLRVNIKRLRATQLRVFLAEIGCDVDFQLLEPIFQNAYRSTLCLDVSESVLPRAGVEFTMTSPPTHDIVWKVLAEQAVGKRLSQNNWDRFHNWSSVVTPIDSKSDWVETLILDSLKKPQNVFSMIEGVVSHLKLTVSKQKPSDLKAYVGFRPVWSETETGKTTELVPAGSDRELCHKLNEAVEAGVQFLLQQRTQDGLWRDFDFAHRASDEWVSGYIGTALMGLHRRDCEAAAERAWSILSDRRDGAGGWGYHGSTPPDADSTAWVLQLASALGVSDDLVEKQDFLKNHINPDGSVRTYNADWLAKNDMTLPQSEAHTTWHDSHTDVAAAVAALGYLLPLDHLRKTQTEDGFWPTFWWTSPAYSTGLAVEALAAYGTSEDQAAIEKAIAWAANAICNETNLFAEAWLMRILLLDNSGSQNNILKLRAWKICGMQNSSGAWDGSATMVVNTMNAETGEIIAGSYCDVHRNFTCATTLAALYKMKNLLKPDHEI